MSPFIGEFIGTALLILLGDGVVANVVLHKTKGNNGGWIVITFGWAIAVFVAVFCVGPISGAHLNPAVTIGLATVDQFPWKDVPVYILAQLLGALAGALVVWLGYKQHFDQTEDKDLKLAVFCTGPAIRHRMHNIVTEIIGTFILVLGVLFIIRSGPGIEVNGVTGKLGLGPLGALPVGLLVLGIGLSWGGPTGYAINPARDLGPRIAHFILPIKNKRDSDWGYSWIPVVGPLIGALIAAYVFKLLLI
jgi:glycerol uptake facilitator protein